MDRTPDHDVIADDEQREQQEDAAGELETVRAQADAYYKNWQRAAADLKNFKRRTEEERVEQSRLHKAALVINILPVFDDLDRAVESVDAPLAGLSWVQGVTAIHRKFAQMLEAMDVAPIAAEHEAFDPALHEAVGQQPGPEGQVLSVLQKGYTLGGRVIRPPLVIVGDGQEMPEADSQESNEPNETA